MNSGPGWAVMENVLPNASTGRVKRIPVAGGRASFQFEAIGPGAASLLR